MSQSILHHKAKTKRFESNESPLFIPFDLTETGSIPQDSQLKYLNEL